MDCDVSDMRSSTHTFTIHVQIQGDMTSPDIAAKIVALAGKGRCDLVLCDGAPDVTGSAELDEYVSISVCKCMCMYAKVLECMHACFVCIRP